MKIEGYLAKSPGGKYGIFDITMAAGPVIRTQHGIEGERGVFFPLSTECFEENEGALTSPEVVWLPVTDYPGYVMICKVPIIAEIEKKQDKKAFEVRDIWYKEG